MVREILEKELDYRKYLFIRGYLITDSEINENEYPFYGNWVGHKAGGYNFWVHSSQHFYKYDDSEKTYFLIGHCINPFDGEKDEALIIENIAKKNRENISDAIDYLNCLTGNFIIGVVERKKITFVTDPSGMLYCCYGKVDEKVYISSHYQLVADICNLTKSSYIKRLEKYKHFYKYGVFFPADITPYIELTRAVQNHFITYNESFEIKRFYPCKELSVCKTDEEYNGVVKKCTEILHKTLELASKKWNDIAISMTGGMDSKTTLACANGLYDRFDYYSYISMHGDKIDADAAHKIAESIEIKHDIFNISENDNDFEKIDVVKAILSHNKGGYNTNANDVRKRIFFSENSRFVEVKSWISEVARANYYKKFGVKKMPKHLSARNMTSMYKVFTTQRKLARETDKIFKGYIERTNFHAFPNGYDESDMYLWEFRYSSWGGMVITAEHSFSNEIFIPFNNRRLLDEMLRAPLSKRISDEFHEDMISYSNSKISDLGITITNWNETKKRQIFEKLYFKINSLLPF